MRAVIALGSNALLERSEPPDAPIQQHAKAAAEAAELATPRAPAESMGPKVTAAIRFASRTGRPAAIGALSQAADVLSGRAGTVVTATITAATTGTDLRVGRAG